MVIDALYLLAGLLLLYFGAEWLVAGAAGLARSLGMRPLIIGLTVVAFGTSAPELVVGIDASIAGQGAIALGNVVGSNIANLGLILGLTALILPPAVDVQVLRREVPVLLAVTALLPLALVDGWLARWEAAVLLVLAVGYPWWMIRSARIGSLAGAAEMEEAAELAAALPPAGSRLRLALRALFGLALLVGGGRALIEGAVGIATTAGMSPRVIGLTIVAVGTSLPELATSLIAAARGHADIAVGNVVGSNIFNILLIGGASAMTAPIVAPIGSVAIDLVAMGALTVFAVAAMRTRRKVDRVEGAVLVLGYVGFLTALLLGR
ncbi:MAG: calcium/sodium antiporter [Kofleriaceae bacterium]|nr:calcium/sodium antiporter [Kofleriaceae bacterium]MCL4225810.1 calcium/sodium antiporter [Myxococcales bacterium]